MLDKNSIKIWIVTGSYSNKEITIVGKDQNDKNKLITITMNKFKFFSVALLASAFASQAQDINQAKRLSMQSNLKVLNRS
jgi:hypothetical protein